MLVSTASIGLIAALIIALSRKFAPLATEWGPVADWVGVAVTFLGFVGAIAALKVQRISTDVQLEQHNDTKADKNRVARNKQDQLDADAREKKERAARSVELTVDARRYEPYKGAQTVDEQPFEVKCRLVFPPKRNKFTNVKFNHPDNPDGFRVVEDTASDTRFTTLEYGARIIWSVSGKDWPHGPEADAKAWVAERTHVTFTDPAGFHWRLDGHGTLKEITESVTAEV